MKLVSAKFCETLHTRASNEGYTKAREDFTITEKAPTRPFSWLKAILALSHLRHFEDTMLNVKVIVGTFKEKALLGAFSVIVKSSGAFG